MPSILIAMPHCYLEPSSGAVSTLRDLMWGLSRRGWEGRVLTGSMIDTPGLTVGALFEQLKLTPRSVRASCGQQAYAVHRTEHEQIPVTVFEPGQWLRPPALEQGLVFLQMLDRAMALRRPDVLLTFSGAWLGRGIAAVARRHGVPRVFWLRNTEYIHRDLFDGAAAVIVPSPFSARHYRKLLGLECAAIPSPILPERVIAPSRQAKYVTFVSPHPAKGVHYFARIAAELGRQRPDIPVLVVVGRGQLQSLAQAGMNLRELPNFRVMPATSEPIQFWSMTRTLLMPSLWPEVFGRVCVEAMLNGVPILAGRRGGLLETVGGAGFVFEIPEAYQPAMVRVPSAEEVAPWVSTVKRLHDDEAYYKEWSDRSRNEARRYEFSGLITQHEQILFQVISQATPSAPPSSPLGEDLRHLSKYFTQPPNFEQFAPLPAEVETTL